MAEFKLGRIRFVWKDQWAASTTYVKDDVVRYGGKTYLCLQGHTANSDFYVDLDNDVWNLVSDGQQWKGAWTATTYYKIGDIATNNGLVYICKTGHTSQTHLESDQGKWDLLTGTFKWRGDWAVSTYYVVGDVVKYGGTVYRCNTAHTSNSSAALLAGGLEADQSSWDIVNRTFDYKGTWTTGTRYKINDVVKDGAGLWICTGINVAGATWAGDSAYWSRFVEGLEFINTWTGATSYVPGDVVTYGGYSYVSLSNNTNKTPTSNASDWAILSTGFNFRGDYVGATAYKVGDVVRLNGYTYLAIADTTGHQPPNLTYWELLNPGYKWRSTWTDATAYVAGDSVKYGVNSYVCVAAHTSAAGSNRPDIDTLGNYWNMLAAGSETAVLTTQGDILYYSASGPARLPVGTDGQVLTVQGSNLYWNTFGDVANVYYVAPTGTDTTANGQGKTLDKPFATIKYACQVVAAGTSYPNANYLLTQNIAWAVREMYQYMEYAKTNSIAPFSPSSTYDGTKTLRDARLILDAISQDLTHSSNANTVNAAQMFFATANTFYNANVTAEIQYFIVALQRLKINIVNQAMANSAPVNNYQSLTGFTPVVNQVINLSYTSESGATTAVGNLFDIVINALTAGNTSGIPLPTTGYTSTIYVKSGTYSEVLPVSIPENCGIVGDELRTVVVQPTTGYTTSNMFYMRNGSSLRNMTLQGLVGTLGAANSYGTQRPSAGAYISLDPGAGPDDPSVWIYKRSPYVQNVTTFGTGATGMKVDGSLHNGGNKSIVANDFTQVIDNGIGAWVTNNARAELVSVFTYYAHIGYLAENGGKIRATNGNNSYGMFGSVSEYVNSTETPVTATVNNRALQAQVGYTMTNGSQVYKLEYSNAGNAYPNSGTTFTFNSLNGINANAVGDEIRDNAVFENRMLTSGAGYVTATNTAQSGTSTSIVIAASDTAISAAYLGMRMVIASGLGVGQYGYITYYSSGTKQAILAKESFAPLTASAVTASGALITVPSTVTLYVGQPITFTGTAIGGFALGTVYYVQAIASSTQFAVSATSGGSAIAAGLSDATGSTMVVNAAGWDHVVVGTAIQTSLDSTTTYSIEPRVTYSAPSFTATSRTLPTSSNWADITYANGRFVAVGNAGASAYSVDGVNWTAMTGLASDTYTVASGTISSTTYYVAVGGNTDTASTNAYYSTNGTSWTAMTGLQSAKWTCVRFGNGRFVAVSNGTATSYSANGTTWSNGGAMLTSTSWTSVAYGSGASKFVAVAGGANSVANAAYSTDGSAWTAATLPASAYWTSVTYGNGRFIAVAQGGNQTAYSLDGITWTTPTTQLPYNYAWKQISYGQGTFLAAAAYLTPTATAAYTGSNQITLSSTSGMAVGQPWTPTTNSSTTTATATTSATVKLSNSTLYASNVLTPGTVSQGTVSNGMVLSGVNPAQVFSPNNLPILAASGSGTAVTITYQTPQVNLSGLVITGTAGQVTFNDNKLYPITSDRLVTITGTLGGTGSITGYASGTNYFILQTNGNTSAQLSAGTSIAAQTLTGAGTTTLAFGTSTTGLYVGQPVYFTGANLANVGLVANTIYYVQSVSSLNVTLALTPNGTALTFPTGTAATSTVYYPTAAVVTTAGTPTGIQVVYSPSVPYVVGQSVNIQGVNPVAYNGAYVVGSINQTSTGMQLTVANTTTATYVSGGNVYSDPVKITGTNSFTSTSSSVSGTTLTVGGTVTGTVSTGQAISGTTATNLYSQIINGNLSLQGTQTGTPVAGMYIGGPNINGASPTLSTANSSSWFAGISTGTAVTFTGSIAPASATDAGRGGVLTVTSAPSGTGIVVGYVLSGTGVVGGTYVSANMTGNATSASSTWMVNISQTVSSTTITATPVIMNVSGVGVGTISPGTVVSWTGGIVAQNLSISSISGNGLSATVTFSATQSAAPFATGQAITITGNANSNFNGTFKVTACSTTICTFDSATSATGAGGTVTSAGTYVTAYGSGTGGTGTYYVSPAPTASVSAGTSFTGTTWPVVTGTLSAVNIIGTAGQFNCGIPVSLTVGMTVTITGTAGGTGSISGYTSGNTYYIIATNGSTTFTLGTAPGIEVNPASVGVTTTAGTLTGLTFTLGYVSYQNSGLALNNVTGYITSLGTGTGGAGTYVVSTPISATGSIAISGTSYSISGNVASVVNPTPMIGTRNDVTVTSSAALNAGTPISLAGTSFGGLLPTSQTLSGVTIAGVQGQFTCSAAVLAVGMSLTISGTLGGTGTITGYSNPTTYYIISTNGSTTFTLGTSPWTANGITTTAGTPTGLTYTVGSTYYVSGTNGSSTTTSLSTTFGGIPQALSTATGSLTATYGATFGGLTSATTYYVASISGNQITVSASSTLTPVLSITSNTGGAWTSVSGAGAAATSPDGINWTPRTLSNLAWNAVTFGNTSTSFTGSISGTTLTVTSGPTGCGITTGMVLNGIGITAGTTVTANLTGSQFSSSSTWTVSNSHATPTGSITITSASPMWVVAANGGTSAVSIPNFTQAQARAVVASGQLAGFRIWEPGSGYTAPPTITIGDPNVTSAATWQVRNGIGVLGNPTFTNRGTGYSTATTTITGTGYADVYQNSQYINVSGMSSVPTAGSNVQFAGNSSYYKLVTISSLTGTPGNYSATLQISPNMTIALSPVHGVAITMRILYSQVRLTGHDFLSVGTGTIATTNYPNTPTQPVVQANETVESGGGRVFYTSTDQDGNFNVGDLFTVQQSTGIATLNANAFNLSGLQTLQLGSVTLGSSNTSISQFSTDGTFTANSDSIVPTQKAIRTYIASQIGGGGSTVNVNTLVAGTVQITGSNISNTAGTQINIKNKANFTQGIDGSPLALNYFLLR